MGHSPRLLDSLLTLAGKKAGVPHTGAVT